MATAVSVTPLGNPTAVTTSPVSTLQAMVDAAGSEALNLYGETFAVTSTVVASTAGLRLCNGRVTSDTVPPFQATAADITCQDMSFERTTASGGATAGADLSCVLVYADRFRWINSDAVISGVSSGGALASIYVNGGLTGCDFNGGRITNSSARQNSSLIYFKDTAVNSAHTIRGIKGSGACAIGFCLFDAVGCTIDACSVSGIAQLAVWTATAGSWANTTGTIYRQVDRTDGTSQTLFNNGTQLAVAASATAPNSNEWGTSGGYVYLNLGATLPSTRTITTNISSGYGILLYSLTGCERNTVTGCYVTAVDGMAYYMATNAGDYGNKLVGCEWYDAAQSGAQDSSLPWAGIGINGSLDTVISGCHGELTGGTGGTATPGIWMKGTGSGVISDCVIRGSSAQSVYAQNGDWLVRGCRGYRATAGDGIVSFYAPAGQTSIFFDGCYANNTAIADRIVGGVQRSHWEGTPASVVIAEPGSTGTRSDGGATTTHYKKHTTNDAANWSGA